MQFVKNDLILFETFLCNKYKFINYYQHGGKCTKSINKHATKSYITFQVLFNDGHESMTTLLT